MSQSLFTVLIRTFTDKVLSSLHVLGETVKHAWGSSSYEKSERIFRNECAQRLLPESPEERMKQLETFRAVHSGQLILDFRYTGRFPNQAVIPTVSNNAFEYSGIKKAMCASYVDGEFLGVGGSTVSAVAWSKRCKLERSSSVGRQYALPHTYRWRHGRWLHCE